RYDRPPLGGASNRHLGGTTSASWARKARQGRYGRFLDRLRMPFPSCRGRDAEPVAWTIEERSLTSDTGRAPSTTAPAEIPSMKRLMASRYTVLASSLLVAMLAWRAQARGAQLTLTWTPGSTDELGFAVERGIGTGDAFGEVARTGHGVTTYVD